MRAASVLEQDHVRYPRSSMRTTCLQVAVCCSVLQCVALCCIVLQWHVRGQCVAAVCCSMLQCDTVYCIVLHCVALCCIVLHCVASCCSGIQRPVCCSVLLFVAL